ncbi:MAG TPA: carbon-nitrogen hydrolase family protein [Bacillota bacterium]
MGDAANGVEVAVVQAAPVIMDRKATTEKAVDLIARAAASGARVIVFPEAFIPAYPRGLTFGATVGNRTEGGRADWLRYWQNAVPVPGETTETIGEAARQAEAYVAMGVIERAAGEGGPAAPGGTLYCTILYFGPDGRLLGKHRKLKPTASERLIWGEGDGSTLTAVDTPYGRMGGLICWENYMPLARMAMYAKGIGLYLAPTADARETWQATIRHIALEGRCFVLGCNQFVTKSMYPNDLAGQADLAACPEVMCRGGSAIVDPQGRYVAGPVYDREEIIRARLDLDVIAASRFDFDVVGHYARPDVFTLTVDERPKRSVEWGREPGR